MSDNILEKEDSQELAQTSEEMGAEGEEKRTINFSVYDAMLAVSLVCVSVAVLLLVMELRSFGNFPFVFPWKTSEVLEGSG